MHGMAHQTPPLFAVGSVCARLGRNQPLKCSLKLLKVSPQVLEAHQRTIDYKLIFLKS